MLARLERVLDRSEPNNFLLKSINSKSVHVYIIAISFYTLVAILETILTNFRRVEVSGLTQTNERIAAVVAPTTTQIDQTAGTALLALAGFAASYISGAVGDRQRLSSDNTAHKISAV